MVKEIRIYVEGGGNDRSTMRRIREGFSAFLDPLRQLARSHDAELRLIPGGSRSTTFEEYRFALRSHPEAFNILLIDSESEVALPRLEHLRRQDRWDVSGLREDHCHLMVQTVEAWLLADPDALAGYYGQNFQRSVLPKHKDIEAVPKGQLLDKPKRATEKTQKGPYAKIRHCADLLGRLDPVRVRQRARHCDLLFQSIAALFQAPPGTLGGSP
jgi:hypothetical protein